MNLFKKFFIVTMMCMVLGCLITPEVTVFAAKDNDAKTENKNGGVDGSGSVNDIDVEYETDGDGNLKVKSTMEDNSVSSWNRVISKFHNQIIGVAGVATVIFIALFIKYFVTLGGSAANPQKRHEALMGILFCGIGFALFGGITVIMSISYYFIR